MNIVREIQPQWLDVFESVLGLCAIGPEDTVCVLAETQSRPVLIQLCELSARRRGARVLTLTLQTPAQAAPLPIRSTGASIAIAGLPAAMASLKASTLVLDCTCEGLLHAPELPEILASGARVLMISNEHPEVLERLVPRAEDEAPVRSAMKRLRATQVMRVRSNVGTDLEVKLKDSSSASPVGGVWGWANKPGQIAHWPGGLVLAFPRQSSVNGQLVLDVGDVNLAFKDYLRDPVSLTIRDDYVRAISSPASSDFEAKRLKATWAAWEAFEGADHCKAVSHIGWGMNRRARWDSLSYYDKSDVNGTELRAVAGSLLYSTGANETAGRHTIGHFDLPLMNCTIELDGEVVVRDGELLI